MYIYGKIPYKVHGPIFTMGLSFFRVLSLSSYMGFKY